MANYGIFNIFLLKQTWRGNCYPDAILEGCSIVSVETNFLLIYLLLWGSICS